MSSALRAVGLLGVQLPQKLATENTQNTEPVAAFSVLSGASLCFYGLAVQGNLPLFIGDTGAPTLGVATIRIWHPVCNILARLIFRRGVEMKKSFAFWGLSLLLIFSAACASARRSGSTVKDATVATGQKVEEKTEQAADATADKTKELARVVDDATITSAIKMKLARDQTVKASSIDVDTKNGNVTLTGNVGSQTEANRAIELARAVEGVKDVKSNLTVKK